MAELFAGKEWQTFLQILPTIPFETWETVWSTVVATLMALVIGLPLGVCLVTGEQGGVRPLPRWLMALLNGLVNLLRSVPFLILMIIVIPLSRAIVGTSIGTVASIVPLVIASFPFVSRLVETSMREVDAGVIEAAQSMGATPLQIITKVMVPESMPSLVANVTIAATTIMGYGAMAGIIGGGALARSPSTTVTTALMWCWSSLPRRCWSCWYRFCRPSAQSWPSSATSASRSDLREPRFNIFFKLA